MLSHAKEGPESCIEVSETEVDERVPHPPNTRKLSILVRKLAEQFLHQQHLMV
jgi:hypothetical protein